MIFSDDRGATINITHSSKFEHSRFKKGLIVYEGLPNMQSSDTNTVIHLGREFWDRLSSVSTFTKQDGMINVKDTVFHNLALGLSVNKLSYQSKNATIYGMPSINYQYFDNFGAVLNTRGFPGTITFKSNIVEKNLIHVRDVRPSFIAGNHKFDSSLSKFEDSVNSQMNLCRTSGTSKVSLFTDFLNPL